MNSPYGDVLIDYCNWVIENYKEINHYHCPQIRWHSAIPLNRYVADIISGSEAFSPEQLDLTMRPCRAYGRSQSEVWRPFDTPSSPEANAEALLRHALICYSAGGHPAFCGDPFDPKVNPTAALMSPLMQAIHPYVGGSALPYAAIHVSQQTETFFFGPVEGLGWGPDPYFEALSTWIEALGESHIPSDYVYDADFAPQTLARYRVALMPLAQTLRLPRLSNMHGRMARCCWVLALGNSIRWGGHDRPIRWGKHLGSRSKVFRSPVRANCSATCCRRYKVAKRCTCPACRHLCS